MCGITNKFKMNLMMVFIQDRELALEKYGEEYLSYAISMFAHIADFKDIGNGESEYTDLGWELVYVKASALHPKVHEYLCHLVCYYGDTPEMEHSIYAAEFLRKKGMAPRPVKEEDGLHHIYLDGKPTYRWEGGFEYMGVT